jgi:hypothetical protein
MNLTPAASWQGVPYETGGWNERLPCPLGSAEWRSEPRSRFNGISGVQLFKLL